MSLPKESVFKRRALWWLNPWIIGLAIVMLLVGIPMVLWLATYKSVPAVVMFSVTYLSLLVFLMLMVKRSLLEPHLKVDEKKIRAAKVEIEANRKKVKEEFVRTELEVLERGETTPVLDAWRLDQSYQKRHPFFSKVETTVLDPSIRELHIRLQVGELSWIAAGDENAAGQFRRQVMIFLHAVAQDPYIDTLKKYFGMLIFEIYSLREDERHIDIPFPILSLTVKAEVMRALSTLPSAAGNDILKLGDCRFADGREIEPHRRIESANDRGSK